MSKKIKLSNFSKELIMGINTAIKDYIRNYDDGENGEENFVNLCKNMEYKKLGIPTEIYEKIETFVETELEPMVYESDKIFAETRGVGTMVDGVQYVDGKEDIAKLFGSFFKVLIDIEKKWDAFAEKELKPYLI